MTPDSHTSSGALVCTHKRGAALALFQIRSNDVSGGLREAEEQLLLLSGDSPRVMPLPQTGASAQFFTAASAHGELFFATCAGLTAENLADLYRFGLSRTNRLDASVGVMGVVEGPGSFTGLRLGCAFVNGLSLGRARTLWSVEGLAPEVVRQRCVEQSVGLNSQFLGETSADHDDPFAVPAAFADLLAHLQNWRAGGARSVSVIEPVYGRDPTPVIKMRQLKGAP